MKNKLSKLSLAIFTCLTVGCTVPANEEGPEVKEPVTVEEKLNAIDGIKSVTPIEDKSETFDCKYLCTIEQKINWDDPNSATFDQRFLFCYSPKTDIVTFNCGGYAINSAYFEDDWGTYLSYMLDTSYVDIEYRLFGESAPEDFVVTDTKYYDQMNSKNASHDFHHIVTEVSKYFKCRTIFTGASKGGYTTEMMAMYYPDDIDCFVSYVAPLCDGIFDVRMGQSLFTDIGDCKYGKEKAKHIREELIELEVNLLREDYREYLLDKAFSKEKEIDGPKTTLTDNEIYELFMSEYGVTLFQYGDFDFEVIERINDLSENDHLYGDLKRYYLGEMVTGCCTRYIANESTPYFVQSYMEMGNYCGYFDGLKEAGAYITTSEENEKWGIMKSVLTTEQLNTFSYDPSYRNALINWYNTTDTELIKIVGGSDPWFYTKAPETTNPHIHLYVSICVLWLSLETYK
ncbi:MAG: hypothetical protein K6F59_00715 [Gammaproteobacteria bacterium]|nr:hypothetical protein [Gammaproteobacteria bacterium]